MAKINFSVLIPLNGDDLTDVALLVIEKHEADGVNSPLTVMEMAKMKIQTLAAASKVAEAKAKSRDKESAIQARDNALGIFALSGSVDYYVKAARDILFALYKGNEQKMGDWGFEINRSGGGISIVIPRNAKQLIELAELIIAKHTALGVDSPISILDMTDFEDKTTTAAEQNALAIKLNQEKELAVEDRDLLCGFNPKQTVSTVGTVLYYVTQARDILLGKYKGNETALGLWGFDVQHGSTPPAEKKSLTGEVTDVAGEIISGATLDIEELGKSATSNINGIYAFYKLTAGTYSMQVNKDGYETKDVHNIVIENNKTKLQNVQLKAMGGSLLVTVYSEGTPLEGAAVKIIETSKELTTDNEGNANFLNLQPGTYNIEVTAPGHQPQIKPKTILPGVSDMLTFEMIPG